MDAIEKTISSLLMLLGFVLVIYMFVNEADARRRKAPPGPDELLKAKRKKHRHLLIISAVLLILIALFIRKAFIHPNNP